MQTTPWESELTAALSQQFGDAIAEFSTYVGQNFLICQREAVVPVLDRLKAEGFDYLVDITALDFPKKDDRFELVYVLYSFARNERVRVKTRIPEGYKPQTAISVHLTANWLEREIFDMFGIVFDEHPDLRRILLPDDWHGYPLRKDYSLLNMDNQWVKENLGIESGR
jgi:NADH-quinone oxidoreductase subunit C